MEIFISFFALLASAGAVVYIWWTHTDTIKYCDAVMFSLLEDIANLESRVADIESVSVPAKKTRSK
jgi:hypothetical protein